MTSLFLLLVIVHSSFIKSHKVIAVLASSNEKVLLNNSWIELPKLCDTLVLMLENTDNHPLYPPKTAVQTKHLGWVKVSQAIVSVASDRSTSYNFYIQVQNEIERAYAELRDRLSQKHFKKCYSRLSIQEKSTINQMSPKIISEAEPIPWELLSGQSQAHFY